jgi:hypothetical protein
MSGPFRLAYIYARASGSSARAWLGERAEPLTRIPRVAELWRTLYREAPPALPEGILIGAAERKALASSIDDFKRLAGDAIREPFFAALVDKPEFAYVKKLAVAIRDGKPLPGREGSGGGTIDLDAYPDLAGLFGKSRYSWLAETGVGDILAVKVRLDKQFYRELWEALEAGRSRFYRGLRPLIRLEAELENLVWALRLKRYYAMSEAEIRPLLIELPGAEVARTAMGALRRRLEFRIDWSGWKWEGFVNPAAEAGEDWVLDVRLLETAARAYLFRKLKVALHVQPFGYVPLYCYYRIKEYESATVLGIVEGIHLEVPHEEMLSYALGLVGGGE